MILFRSGIRQWFRHPWQTALTLVGVALGVGIVTAIDLANESSYRAFRYAAEALGGKATHQISGGPSGLPEQLYTRLRVEHGVRPSAPVVEGTIQISGRPGGSVMLLGVDPFADRPFRGFSQHFFQGADLLAFFTRPAAGMLLDSTARRFGVKQGEFLEVEARGNRHRLFVCGLLQPESEVARQGLDSVIVTDIATAQELLGAEGRLSRIDLIVPEGAAGERYLRQLRGVIPAEATIVAAGARSGSLERMTRAFRLNLTALSLLALVVGMFLIYNTITFSVVRRRRLIGLLRAIGVTRREIFGLLCAESVVVGLVGTGAGLVLGQLLGGHLVGFVSRTINDLYFVLDVRSVALAPLSFAKGGVLGLGATMVATIPPALEATSAPPRAVLSRADQEARVRRLLPWAALGGIVVMAAGGVILGVEGGVGAGFAGLFALIIGYALLIPGASVLLTRALRPIMGTLFGPLGRMAARGVVVSLSRTSVATAALVVAVSATLGIGLMVGSFRQAVASWLGNWLKADVYVTTTGTGTGRNKPPLDPDLVERLARVRGAALVSMTRRATIEGSNGPVELLAMDIPEPSFSGYRFREGRAAEAWGPFRSGTGVIVSEPFAYRNHVHAGERIRLRTTHGEVDFPVTGVFYDYGSDVGVVAMSRAAYVRFWGDRSVDGMGFYASPGESPEGLVAGIRGVVGEKRVTVVSNRALRNESLSVFDRTFAITGVLRALTILVAFVGILSALMAIQLERSREFAVMRAVGLTPWQTWGVICSETGLMGIIAGLLSLPLGLLQAYVLVYAINRRSFGWTIEIVSDPAMMVEAVLLSVVAAVLAGLYPAWRIAVSPPAAALKEEE